MFCFKKQDLLLEQLHVLVAFQTVSARVGNYLERSTTLGGEDEESSGRT